MPKDSLTPEERLLQVIDNPQGAAKPGPASWAGRLRAPSVSGALLWVTARLKGSNAGHPLVTLRMVNRLLLGATAVLSVAWVIDFVSTRSQYQARLEMVERTQLVAPTQTKTVTLPSLEFAAVLDQAQQRNMFTLIPPKVEAPAPVAQTEDMTPYLNDLKLVGVIWSENPQAMIEQVKEGKTSLVGKGERIGPFRVKEILKEKIILGADSTDETWELQ